MRIRPIVSLLTSLLVFVVIPSTPSFADSDALRVEITSLSPTLISSSSTIRMSGTVTNDSNETWTAVHAYMVIPRQPYTQQLQVHDLLTAETPYVGERIINTDMYATLGDLAGGESKNFTITVPVDQIDLSTSAGVFPVGVQIVATNPQGERSGQAIARDVSFLPQAAKKMKPAATGLVWPFVENWDVEKPSPVDIAQSLTSGQLRRYLDAALATPSAARTVMIDPALIDSVDMFINEAEELELDAALQTGMTSWRAELIRLTQESDTWIIDYGRPDYAGFIRSDNAKPLLKSTRETTNDANERHKISGKRIVWPKNKDATPSFISALSAVDSDLIIVPTDRLAGWSEGLGSKVKLGGKPSDQSLFALSLTEFSQSRKSDSLFTQYVLSKAVLASLENRKDSDASADALTLINPSWDPDLSKVAPLLQALEGNAFIKAASLSPLPLASDSRVSVRKTSGSNKFSQKRIAATTHLNHTVRIFEKINLDNKETQLANQSTARALSIRWTGNNTAAVKNIETSTKHMEKFFNDISLESPSTITLSGHEGGFPITIHNGTQSPVRLSLLLDADVPGITFNEPSPVRVEPGSSHTVTINADMGTQVAATVSAHLTTLDGEKFGTPSAFVLRSSKVGQFVWIGMAFALLLVFAAIIRRIINSKKTPANSTHN